MIRLLQLLIWGHVHKWKTREVVHLTQHNGDLPDTRGKRVYVVCETCGKHKKFDLV